jgi:type II secretory pathway component PulF
VLTRVVTLISLVLIGMFGILILVMIPSTIGAQRGGEGPILLLGMLWIGLVAIFTIAILARGRRRAMTVLDYLEQALRLNLPLPRVIQSIGEAEGGHFGREMDQCRQALEQGAPLAVVVGAVPRMPRRIVSMIAAAERVGHLPQVLTRVMQQRREAMLKGLGGRGAFYRIYPWILAIVLVSMVSLLMTFVMPKYETIFHDFRVELPWVTRVTLSIVHGLGPLVGFGIVMVCAVMLFSEISSILNGRRLDYDGRLFARLANQLPGLRTIRMQSALGDVLDFAADSVELGRPLDLSLAEAAQITPNTRLREQIDLWIDGMKQGKMIAEAARGAGLPSIVYGMIGGAMQSQDLAKVLHFLGRYYRTRFSRTLILLQAAVGPGVALIMGFFVGWVALTMFLPIIHLIDRANPYLGGMR